MAEGNVQQLNEELLSAPPSYNFKSRCNRECVDIFKPLAKTEWKIICKVMKKLNCIVTLQVLPFGYHSHMPLSSGVVNLFLRKFMIHTHENQSLLPILSEADNEQDPKLTLLPLEQIIINDAPKAVKVDKYFTSKINLNFKTIK